MKSFELIKDEVIRFLGNEVKITNIEYYCSLVKGSEYIIEYFIEYKGLNQEDKISVKIIHSQTPLRILRECYKKKKKYVDQ